LVEIGEVMNILVRHLIEDKIDSMDLRVLFLRFQKYTFREIAEMLGCSAERARQREARGMRAIKIFLKGEL
jgi:DNA-directed RNA polymerase sigma subunit (sigma70/sigma32)